MGATMQSGGKCAVSMACRYISWSLVLAFVGVSGVPEAAAAVGRVDPVPAAVRLAVSAPIRIAPGGTVLLTGRVSPSSAKLVLQRQYRGRWVSSGRLVSRTRNGRFVLAVRAPTTGGTLRIRLLGLRAGHRIASIVKRVAVRRRAPTSAGPTTSATVVSPSTVKSVPRAGDPGTVVLDGDQSPTPGSVLASSVGPNTPSGFLGKVVSVSHAWARRSSTPNRQRLRRRFRPEPSISTTPRRSALKRRTPVLHGQPPPVRLQLTAKTASATDLTRRSRARGDRASARPVTLRSARRRTCRCRGRRFTACRPRSPRP